MRPLMAAFACAALPNVVTIAQNPGGYGTNLRAWFKAGANAYSATGPLVSCTNNSTVTQWNDQTANALHLSQATAGQRPTWLDGSASAYFNYNPSIKFTDHYLQRAAPGIFVSGTQYNKLNLYAVYYDYDAANFDWLFFTSGSNGFTRISLSMNWGGAAVFDCDVPSTSNRVSPNTTSQLPALRTNIVAVKADNTGIYGGSPASANLIQAFCNGSAGPSKTTHTAITEGNYPTEIGDNELVATDATNYPFTGELAELFVYTGSISQTIHERIESYLALKYSARLFSHDYFNTAGTTVFTNSGSYVNGVIGIMRDDNQGFYQRQSRQPDDTTRVYLGTLATTNLGNATNFSSDLQSLVVGHNGGKTWSTTGTATEKPGGLGIYSRINREWKVTNTAFSGTFSMDFKLVASPITASDLRLLVDDDGNFTNASLLGTSSGLTFSYSGGVITVGGISTTHIPMNSTRYLTIASMSAGTPLPVEMLWFNAQPGTGHTVDLDWATATENNNSHFEVERSTDGVTFNGIGELAGNGTSSLQHNYDYTDALPFSGTSYYRLKQVNYDGAFTYSETRAVEIVQPQVISAWPNPADDFVVIAGVDWGSGGTLRLCNTEGREVPLPHDALSNGKLNVSTLPRGIYIARMGDQVARIVKR